MSDYIKHDACFDLRAIKGNGNLYIDEINKIRGFYEVLRSEPLFRCCNRVAYPKEADYHMFFKFVVAMETEKENEKENEKDNVDDGGKEDNVDKKENEAEDGGEKESVNEIKSEDVVEKHISKDTEIVVVDLYGVYNNHNIYFVAVGNNKKRFYSFAKPDDYDAFFSESWFPDLKVKNLDIGVAYGELASKFGERKDVEFSHSLISDAVKVLSGDYKAERSGEWCKALVLLLAVTSESVRSYKVCKFMENVFNDESDEVHKMPPKMLKEMNIWGKVSKCVYSNKGFPFHYKYKTSDNIEVEAKIRNMEDASTIFAVLSAPPHGHEQIKDQKFKGIPVSHTKPAQQTVVPSLGSPRFSQGHASRFSTWTGLAAQVSTSMKDLCFDQFKVSREENDPKRVKGNQEPRQFVQLGCVTISESLGATCVYPLQVIMTRVEAQHSNTNAPHSSMSNLFGRTLQHEGFKGFHKGLFPNLLKVFSSTRASTKLKAAFVVAKGLSM